MRASKWPVLGTFIGHVKYIFCKFDFEVDLKYKKKLAVTTVYSTLQAGHGCLPSGVVDCIVSAHIHCQFYSHQT